MLNFTVVTVLVSNFFICFNEVPIACPLRNPYLIFLPVYLEGKINVFVSTIQRMGPMNRGSESENGHAIRACLRGFTNQANFSYVALPRTQSLF